MIKKLTSGMTNLSYQLDDSIIRIAGMNTNTLINRSQEQTVYATIRDLHISDDVEYIDDTVKISKFIKNARNANAHNVEDVSRCVALMKKLHNADLHVPHEFDFASKYREYLKLMPAAKRTKYVLDYARIFSFIESQSIHKCLTHIDAVSTNFLLTDDKDYLIDWEYAAEADPDIDLAMFAVYDNLSRSEFDALIDAYDNHVSLTRRMKIYAYASLAGTLWSMWCDIKRQFTDSDYQHSQLEYAIIYYNIVEAWLNVRMNRAIILAAGKGSRLKELTANTPKALLKVNNQTIIERQIECLHEIGVYDITVVVGYLAEQFDFLTTKGVNLVYNPDYNTQNNISSLKVVSNLLCENVIILDGDIYFKRNILKHSITHSSYSCIDETEESNEWHAIVLNNEIVYFNTDEVMQGHAVVDITYWLEPTAKKLAKAIMKEDRTDIYWDNVVAEHLSEWHIHCEHISSNDVQEIDTIENLEAANERQ